MSPQARGKFEIFINTETTSVIFDLVAIKYKKQKRKCWRQKSNKSVNPANFSYKNSLLITANLDDLLTVVT